MTAARGRFIPDTCAVLQIERLADVLREKEMHLREMNEKLSKITDESSSNDSVLSIMEDALTEKVGVREKLKKVKTIQHGRKNGCEIT